MAYLSGDVTMSHRSEKVLPGVGEPQQLVPAMAMTMTGRGQAMLSVAGIMLAFAPGAFLFLSRRRDFGLCRDPVSAVLRERTESDHQICRAQCHERLCEPGGGSGRSSRSAQKDRLYQKYARRYPNSGLNADFYRHALLLDRIAFLTGIMGFAAIGGIVRKSVEPNPIEGFSHINPWRRIR